MFTENFGDFATSESPPLRAELPGGYYATAHIRNDDTPRTPWEDDGGHGPVRREGRHWGHTPKRAGEIVLHETRDTAWIYDFADACKTARADGRGFGGKGVAKHRAAGLSLRQIAAAAAREDADFLAAWLKDDWFYVGVVVQIFDADDDPADDSVSLWGVECNYPNHKPRGQANEYLTEVANELLAEAIDNLRQRGVDLAPAPGTPPRVYEMTNWS